jgi:hypothetical protein
MKVQVCCPLEHIVYVAATNVWVEVDEWPLIHGGCYHVTGRRTARYVTCAEACHLKSRGLPGITRGIRTCTYTLHYLHRVPTQM